MTGFLDAYAESDDVNEQYALLRDELARLRGLREEDAFFDPEAVAVTVERLSADVDGDLVVFAANDFGLPLAYRPASLDRSVQDDLRRAILENKYDDENEDLDALRRTLLDEHSGVHKAIVAEHTGDAIRYHLPEGSNDATNFLTVREMVGLVDYTTNSAQADGLSRTY